MVKFVKCILLFRVHMTFYTLTKGYTVHGNLGIHYKLDQIQKKGIVVKMSWKEQSLKHPLLSTNF